MVISSIVEPLQLDKVSRSNSPDNGRGLGVVVARCVPVALKTEDFQLEGVS